MRTVREPISSVKKLLETPTLDFDAKYRKSTYTCTAVIDGKSVAFNSFTGEIVELSAVEQKVLNKDFVMASEDIRELVEKHFLVSEECDEIKLVDETATFIKMFEKIRGIGIYTIFTTTDCNARCFYCFELGCARIDMSLDTAKDVVEYIKKTKYPGEIKIDWLGGEPLCNYEVIDFICDELEKAGVEFSSQITSNGFLFDDAICEKAVSKWRVEGVQITLDGTEKIYNDTKAYVNCEGQNPFVIVTDNIERLLKHNIRVQIRLNMSRDNKDDLFKLVDFIAERYKGYDNFTVYSHLLFDLIENTSKETELSYAKDLIALEDYCISKGVFKYRMLDKKLRTHQCKMDNDGAAIILPTGKLSKCSEFTDSGFVGDIYQGVTDKARIAELKICGKTRELCDGCLVYPLCMKIKNCPQHSARVCSPAQRLIAETNIFRQMETTYKKIINETQKEN